MVEGESEAERLRAGFAAGKGPRLLILEAGYQPTDAMIGELDGVARTIARDSSVRLLATPATAWQRLFPAQAPTVGLFAPADRCRAFKGTDFRHVVAGLKPNAIFATRAWPIV